MMMQFIKEPKQMFSELGHKLKQGKQILHSCMVQELLVHSSLTKAVYSLLQGKAKLFKRGTVDLNTDFSLTLY